MKKTAILFFVFISIIISCDNGNKPVPPVPPGPELGGATPFLFETPLFFQEMDIPEDNPLTVEGIDLGRNLFYDERLSGDNTQSCATCHIQNLSFQDSLKFSVGIIGIEGTRQSMTLVNLGWQHFYFWDGRSATLEDQIIQPVINPIEMNAEWSDVMVKLRQDEEYMKLFAKVFSTVDVDSTHVAKAIAQFLRIVVSDDSKYDRFRRGEYTPTESESRGMDLMVREGGDPELGQGGQWGGDCFHCHPLAGLQFSDYQLHNNGLDSVFTDLGRGEVTGDPNDFGRFKTPSLRNVEFSAPYMHDGRFASLEEVIEHYNSGGHASSTVDPFMKFTSGGLQLSEQSKQDLIAFLKMLSDPVFLSNPDYSDPDE